MVAVGVRLQLGAHLGQRSRRIPVLEPNSLSPKRLRLTDVGPTENNRFAALSRQEPPLKLGAESDIPAEHLDTGEE